MRPHAEKRFLSIRFVEAVTLTVLVKKQDPNAGNSHVAECSKTRIRALPVVGAEQGANFSGPLGRCNFLLVLDDAVAS